MEALHHVLNDAHKAILQCKNNPKKAYLKDGTTNEMHANNCLKELNDRIKEITVAFVYEQYGEAAKLFDGE